MIQILFLLAVFSASSRIDVFIADAAGQPLPNVRVSLDLYFYEAAPSSEIRGAFSDECTTDGQGRCSLWIGQTQDLVLRGSLDLGQYGIRNVEWQGGVLEMPIRIEPQRQPQCELSLLPGVIVFALLGVIIQHKRTRA
jgi:hypothetical protein